MDATDRGAIAEPGTRIACVSWLIWPTQDLRLPYRAVTLRAGGQQQEDAEPAIFDPTMLHTLPVGNLAFGQGCLAIAGLDELVVYVPAHKLHQLPPLEVGPQARIDALYQQARRQASAGQTAEALRSYQRLLEMTKSHRQAREWRALIETRLPATPILRPRPVEPPVKKKPPPELIAPNARAGPALPLVRAWSHEDGKIWAADFGDDFFFCTQAGQVTCRSLADGALRWKANLDVEPTWFGRWGDLVLICGKDEVVALRVDAGRSAWSFAAPSRKWRLGSVQAGVPKILSGADGFVHVERWDDTLLLLDDHRHFYRLRLDTGEIAWQYASPSAPLRPLAGAAFGPFVTRVGDRLWVQSITGQPYWLGAKPTLTGLPSRPWVQAPLVIGSRIVLAGEDGRVFGSNTKPPHDRHWTYQPPWPTSLTGDLCRLVNKDSVLLALVPRNEGHDCVRLDPENGKLLWSLPTRQFDALEVPSLVIGDLSFYYVRAGKLHARSLNDGALQWTQALPSGAAKWQVRYTKDYLAVYSPEALKDDGFTVAFIDPWDGRWLQRLTFPGMTGLAETVLTPQFVLVSAGGRIFGFRTAGNE